MPLQLILSDRVKRWFFKSAVTALAAAIIGFGGWFIGSHMMMRETIREQKTHIQNLDESNTAQWRLIAELQNKVSTLSTNAGVIERIQTEFILPHFVDRTGNNFPVRPVEPSPPFEDIGPPSPLGLPQPSPVPNNSFDPIEEDIVVTDEEVEQLDQQQRHIERAR